LKNLLVLLLFLNINFLVNAGNDDYPIGARSSAIGNASVSLSDVWSAHHNQAGLGFVRDYSGGVYYENRFLLKELSIKGLAIVVPIKAGTFGFCNTNFGYKLYSENKYSFSFAKALGKTFSAGIALDYLSTKIAEGYGSRSAFAGEVGIIAKPLKGLTIGAHVYNPTRTKIADYNDERLPTIFRLGADYSFSEKVILLIETDKNISQKAQFKVGIEYKVVKEFYLRTGISTNPTISSFGFGINLQNLKIDFACSYHQVLGFSPQLGLSYTIKKIEKSIPKIVL
jgi:hypothetical protein